MFIRLIKRFLTAAALLGYGGWAVSLGLPATGELTPFWGWVLTISGLIALFVAIPLSVRGVRLFRDENRKIELRQPLIAELREALSNLEPQVDDVCSTVEDIPLSYYEINYLSKFDGYQEFKRKYIAENSATESDAQYVALGAHYGMNDNPLFSDSLKTSPAQELLNRIRDLKQKLPDSRLHNLIELLVDTKKRQSISTIDHKLNPSRWNAYVSDIKQRDDVEYKLGEALRKVRREVNRRLSQIANGVKYE
ncbi:hypothetical protein ACFLV6_01075 [Chloroflexota bacterium]